MYNCSHFIHRFGRSRLNPSGQLSYRSDDTLDPDGVLHDLVKIKIHHYRNVYVNRPAPIDSSPFLLALRVAYIRISLPIPLDLSTRPYFPPPRFLRSRQSTSHPHPSVSSLTPRLIALPK
jgi:hypothetical protein